MEQLCSKKGVGMLEEQLVELDILAGLEETAGSNDEAFT